MYRLLCSENGTRISMTFYRLLHVINFHYFLNYFSNIVTKYICIVVNFSYEALVKNVSFNLFRCMQRSIKISKHSEILYRYLSIN